MALALCQAITASGIPRAPLFCWDDRRFVDQISLKAVWEVASTGRNRGIRELALAFLDLGWKRRDRVLIHCLNLVRSPYAWALRWLSEEAGNENLPLPRWPLVAGEAGGFDLLLSAIDYGRPDLAFFLLDHGARADTRNSTGGTLLHTIAQYGFLAKDAGDAERLMDRLIREGVSVDATDELGRTALHCAVYFGHGNICDYLLKRRANSSLRDNAGRVAEAMPAIGGEPLACAPAFDAFRLRCALRTTSRTTARERVRL